MNFHANVYCKQFEIERCNSTRVTDMHLKHFKEHVRREGGREVTPVAALVTNKTGQVQMNMCICCLEDAVSAAVVTGRAVLKVGGHCCCSHR